MKERRHRWKGQDTTSTLTKTVTHIRLSEVNSGKLAALDVLAPVYLALCQEYVTYFCTEEAPDKFHDPVFATPLSERWHRVAIQQAAGTARSWRTNRDQAYQSYLEEMEDSLEMLATPNADQKVPEWKEWNTPVVRQTSIQANVNVVALEVSNDSTFKGVEKLPSTRSKSGQRLIRHVRQQINRAVNTCRDEHPDARIAYEDLSIGSMKFKAHAMNAYLRASNLARIPKKIAWETAKRGMRATVVKSEYSSQECSVCHYPDRANRPDQQTFCCVVCGFSTHADHNAAHTIARREGDEKLFACTSKEAIKALLMQRHETWKKQNGWL